MRKLLRKPLILAVALLATAGVLMSCDNGTYTFGTHTTSGYRYELWGNPCGISYGGQSLVGNRLLVESHPSLNGQQYGLLGCTTYAPMFYAEFNYLSPGYPGNPYTWLNNGESRMYLNSDPLSPEIPVGSRWRSVAGDYDCEYRLHYNWPGNPGWFKGYWERLPRTGSGVMFSSTAATIVEFRPYGGLGRNCGVQRVS